MRTWILVAVLAAVAAVSVRSCATYKQQLAAAKLDLNVQRQLNDSTAAVLASAQLDQDRLQGLLRVKDQLQGKLIAGLVVHVPARDTSVTHAELPTTTTDSTRIATFRDSTFAGVLSGTVTAPPCCQPLALQYQVQRPAFEPSVGFIQVGDKQVAVVVWQGERFEIASPYTNIPKPPKKVGEFLEGGYALEDGAHFATIRAGAYVRPWNNWSGFTSVRGDFARDARPRLEFGIRKEF